MRVHIDGLDALAVDHYRQALPSGLLRMDRVQHAATAEGDARRGGRTLEEISTCGHSIPSFVKNFRNTGKSVAFSPDRSHAPGKLKASRRFYQARNRLARWGTVLRSGVILLLRPITPITSARAPLDMRERGWQGIESELYLTAR
jgi:hypothetical protein